MDHSSHPLPTLFQFTPSDLPCRYAPTPALYPFLLCSPKTHTASPEEPPSALELGEDIHHLALVYGQETAVRGHVVLKGHSHGDGVWRRNIEGSEGTPHTG